MGRHEKQPTNRTWQEFPELPPRPDPQTGEPFPPEAPGFRGPKREGPPKLSTRIFPPPKPPEGMGPVLAWRHDTIIGQIRKYLVALLLCLAILAGISLFSGDGISDLGYWQFWVLALVFAWPMSRPLDFETQAAGADWMSMGRRKRWYQRRARGGHFRMYDLVTVECSAVGVTQYIHLVDIDGATVYRPIDAMMMDRRIYDLLFNGIIHSVANGAQTNRTAVELLKLDQTPAVDLHDKTVAEQQASPNSGDDTASE